MNKEDIDLTTEQKAELFDLLTRAYKMIPGNPRDLPDLWNTAVFVLEQIGVDDELETLEEWTALGLTTESYVTWCFLGQRARGQLIVLKTEDEETGALGGCIMSYATEEFTMIAVLPTEEEAHRVVAKLRGDDPDEIATYTRARE